MQRYLLVLNEHFAKLHAERETETDPLRMGSSPEEVFFYPVIIEIVTNSCFYRKQLALLQRVGPSLISPNTSGEKKMSLKCQKTALTLKSQSPRSTKGHTCSAQVKVGLLSRQCLFLLKSIAEVEALETLFILSQKYL